MRHESSYRILGWFTLLTIADVLSTFIALNGGLLDEFNNLGVYSYRYGIGFALGIRLMPILVLAILLSYDSIHKWVRWGLLISYWFLVVVILNNIIQLMRVSL